MENIKFQSLVQVKFDLTIFQNNLTNALKMLDQKINQCVHQSSQLQLRINEKFNHSDQQIQQINNRVDNWQEQWSNKIENINKSNSNIRDTNLQNASHKKTKPLMNKIKKGVDKVMKTSEAKKENTAIEEIAENKMMESQNEQNATNLKKLSLKNQHSACQFAGQHEEIIQACEDMMNNWVKQVNTEINKLKMKLVVNQFGNRQNAKKNPIINNKKNPNSIQGTMSEKIEYGNAINQKENHHDHEDNCSENDVEKQSKQIDALGGEDNLKSENNQIRGQETGTGFNLSLYFNKLKSEIFRELREGMDQQKGKINDNSKNISLMADHIVIIKSKVQQSQAKNLLRDGDFQKMQQQFSSIESQILLLKQANKAMKNDLNSISTKLLKQDQIIDETLSQARKENVNSNQSFREDQAQSVSSRRSTMNANKRQSVINRNSVLGGISLDSYEDMIKKLNSKVIVLTQRLNKMEDDKKFRDSKTGFLPKLQKEGKTNGSSAVSMDLIKSEIKRLNDDLLKTNQKLSNTKTRLNELYQSHAEIPAKIADLYQKLREKHELQQDRLIQLIKQLINRCLADPFNNNFTNTLKRQINVKFLEIKHEYYGILKEIQNKVQDRAQQKQLIKLRQQLQENILQVKTIIFKKCETQDFKKGIKYLQKKLLQLQSTVRSDNTNADKTTANNYIVNKKH